MTNPDKIAALLCEGPKYPVVALLGQIVVFCFKTHLNCLVGDSQSLVTPRHPMSRSPLVENRGSADPYYAIREYDFSL